MTTDTLVPPVLDDDDSRPSGGEPPVPSRREVRRRREASSRRSRHAFAAALAVCVAVPTAVVVSMWSNLNEPFWFNEQWRAYYISNSGNWWQALKTDGAPFPAGWYFLERASGAVFGSTELTLRLPTAIFLPVSCVLFLLLARRWMPLVPAVVVALVGSLAGCLVGFAVQLSEYQLDATAVVAILLLHEVAWDGDDPGWRSRRVVLAYAGITLACMFSTPAVFIAGPILLLDVARSAWRRTITLRSVAAVVAGILILAQLVFFVIPQNALTKSDYWDVDFLPHGHFGTQLAFVWDGLTGFVTGLFTTSAQGQAPALVLGSNHTWILDLTFGLLLAVGAARMARSERGRTILCALVASVLVTLVASYQRYWPFGFVRTNYYEVPILILVAGVGAVTAGGWARSQFSSLRSSGRSGNVRAVLAVGACVAVLIALVYAGSYEVSAYRQTRSSVHQPAFGNQVGEAVAAVRSRTKPGDVVIVSGFMAMQGWDYYQFDYAGRATKTGPVLPGSHVVSTSVHGSRAITHVVAAYRPGEVFYFFPWGTTQQEVEKDLKAISAGGPNCIQGNGQSYSVSGMLIPIRCP
jgi:hypothetical protein